MNKTICIKNNDIVADENLPVFGRLVLHVKSDVDNSIALGYSDDITAETSNNDAAISYDSVNYFSNLTLKNKGCFLFFKAGEYDIYLTSKYNITIIDYTNERQTGIGFDVYDVKYLELSKFRTRGKYVTGTLEDFPFSANLELLDISMTQIVGNLKDLPNYPKLREFLCANNPNIEGNITQFSKFPNISRIVLLNAFGIVGNVEDILLLLYKNSAYTNKHLALEFPKTIKINNRILDQNTLSDAYFGSNSICLKDRTNNNILAIYNNGWKYTFHKGDSIQMASGKDSPTWSIVSGNSLGNITSSGLLSCNEVGTITVTDGSIQFVIVVEL